MMHNWDIIGVSIDLAVDIWQYEQGLATRCLEARISLVTAERGMGGNQPSRSTKTFCHGRQRNT